MTTRHQRENTKDIQKLLFSTVSRNKFRKNYSCSSKTRSDESHESVIYNLYWIYILYMHNIL